MLTHYDHTACACKNEQDDRIAGALLRKLAETGAIKLDEVTNLYVVDPAYAHHITDAHHIERQVVR